MLIQKQYLQPLIYHDQDREEYRGNVNIVRAVKGLMRN